MSQISRRIVGFAAAAAVLAADQASKFWAIGLLNGPDRPAFELTPFLALVMSWNRGIAYTMLRSDGDFGRFALVGVALAAVFLLGSWLWRSRTMASALGIGCLIGGALGNALDRVVHGAVADFLYFHTPFSLGPLSNYVFNLADAAIFVGVVLLVYDAWAARESVAGGDPGGPARPAP
ncbi:signal peptidase II [Rhodoblastus sp.]|uniref:signal peptidase II n=1 Tax=Rhodoblastus sp. TaxID=1962975 RepID=UPI0026020F85|nr:signal peptidase II [Rhodoblastus sp.]